MKRVVIVGPPGSGKTTVGQELSKRTGIVHTEIDSLWWEPNWTEAGETTLRERLQPVADRDEWILDGNYFSVGAHDVVWPRADTIVWLDLPRIVTVPRVVRRTIVRAITRRELWGTGNRESLALLRPDSIVRFAWTSHAKYNLRYLELWDDTDLTHLTWVRLRTRREIRRWLGTVTEVHS